MLGLGGGDSDSWPSPGTTAVCSFNFHLKCLWSNKINFTFRTANFYLHILKKSVSYQSEMCDECCE